MITYNESHWKNFTEKQKSFIQSVIHEHNIANKNKCHWEKLVKEQKDYIYKYDCSTSTEKQKEVIQSAIREYDINFNRERV